MIADIIAYDRTDRPILIASVKAYAMKAEDVARAIEHIAVPDESPPIRFLMLADYQRIRLIDRPESGPRTTRLDLSTTEVLGHYDSEAGDLIQRNGIFHRYLVRLIEGWLRDMAYHWHSPDPPALNDVASVGLLPLLEGGTTRSGVELESDLVR